VDLPFGQGRHFLSTLHGIPQGVIGGWGLNGVTTLQSGFPLSLAGQYAALSAFGAGEQRPDVVPGCQKRITGSAQSRLNEWFNTSCFTQPDSYGFGNESRNDSVLRSAGVTNFDLGLTETIPVHESVNVQFRAEAFNAANRVQFGPPATTLGNPGFGTVSYQANSPRVYQFSLRANF
jgi:hypothetical protein